MPHLIHSFPSLTEVPALKHSWRNSMPTHALPPLDPHLLHKVAHTSQRPATAAHNALCVAWLTLIHSEIPMFFTLLHISYRTARLSRFFAHTYLRTSPFITYFGL